MKFLTTLLLLACVVFTNTACNKEKAMKTVRQADELAAKMLVYGRNIAKANNDSFAAGNIAPAVHLKTNEAIHVYAKALDAFVVAIEGAKRAIAAGEKPSGQVDILKALFDQSVVQSAFAMISAMTVLPDGVQDKVSGWIAAVQLAIASFRGLFAELENNLNQEVNAHA